MGISSIHGDRNVSEECVIVVIVVIVVEVNEEELMRMNEIDMLE